MDMNTNDYSCEKGVGHFSAVDLQGSPVVPETYFSTPEGMLNWIRWYMSIPSEEGYRIRCYEANTGKFAPGAGELVAEEYVKLLETIYATK
jgi:hypothetical protein